MHPQGSSGKISLTFWINYDASVSISIHYSRHLYIRKPFHVDYEYTAGLFLWHISSILAQPDCILQQHICTELSKQEYHLLGSDSNLSDLLSTAKSSGNKCFCAQHIQKKNIFTEAGKAYSKTIEMRREIGNNYKNWMMFMRKDIQWSYRLN